MKISVLAVGFAASLLSISALAHKEGHDHDTKPLAKSCADLAYPHRFEVDPAYPEIKALVAKCDTAKKAATKKATTKAGITNKR